MTTQKLVIVFLRTIGTAAQKMAGLQGFRCGVVRNSNGEIKMKSIISLVVLLLVSSVSYAVS